MSFYIRFFEHESIVSAKEEICPFLKSNEAMLPEELSVVNDYLNSYKLKSGTNRIFLDSSKKRYLVIIPTKATELSYFQKSGTSKRTAKGRPVKAKDSELSSCGAVTKEKPKAQNCSQTIINEDSSKVTIKGSIDKLDVHYIGWHLFSLQYYRKEEGQFVVYYFKAKIKDGTSTSAYQKMRLYLEEKFGTDCIVPAMTSEVFTLLDEFV